MSESRFETNACDQCYRTKQTCTKNIPQCQRCQKSSTPCTYSFGKFMGKPKKRLKSRQLQLGDWNVEKQSAVNKESGIPEGWQQSGVGKQHIPSPEIYENSRQDFQSLEPVNTPFSDEPSILVPVSGFEKGKKRAMNLSACDQCYRFKVKCVREGEYCQRCSGNNNVCTFSLGPSSEKGDNIELELTERPPKRRRVSIIDKHLPTPKTDSLSYEKEWAATNISTERRSNDLHPETNFNGEEHPFSLSLDTSERSFDFFGQEATLESTISWSTTTYQPSSLDNLYSEQHINHLDHSNTENSNQSTISSQKTNQKQDHGADCSCLLSALSTLSTLHELCHFSTRGGTPNSLDSILSIAHESLLVCETVVGCNTCSTYMMLMLCIAILQQIYNCYSVLSSSIHGGHSSPSLTIKFGETEFYEVGFVPSMMQAILSGENKRAKGVCESLINACGLENRGCENQWGDLGGQKGYESLKKFLGVLKRKFVS